MITGVVLTQGAGLPDIKNHLRWILPKRLDWVVGYPLIISFSQVGLAPSGTDVENLMAGYVHTKSNANGTIAYDASEGWTFKWTPSSSGAQRFTFQATLAGVVVARHTLEIVVHAEQVKTPVSGFAIAPFGDSLLAAANAPQATQSGGFYHGKPYPFTGSGGTGPVNWLAILFARMGMAPQAWVGRNISPYSFTAGDSIDTTNGLSIAYNPYNSLEPGSSVERLVGMPGRVDPHSPFYLDGGHVFSLSRFESFPQYYPGHPLQVSLGFFDPLESDGTCASYGCGGVRIDDFATPYIIVSNGPNSYGSWVPNVDDLTVPSLYSDYTFGAYDILIPAFQARYPGVPILLSTGFATSHAWESPQSDKRKLRVSKHIFTEGLITRYGNRETEGLHIIHHHINLPPTDTYFIPANNHQNFEGSMHMAFSYAFYMRRFHP